MFFYVFLLLSMYLYSYCSSMYSYCCLCILIVRPCILIVVYVFLLLSMYSYCCLCILIVVYVFLLSSMYSYCSSKYSYRFLCILIVVHVLLDAATLTEVFQCFFLRCKGITSQEEARPALIQFLCCSMYCLFCIVLCIVLCKYVLLPQGDNPIVVNKYIISYQVLHVFIYCKRKIMQASNYVYT